MYEGPLATLKEFYICRLLVYQAEFGAPVSLICECYKPCFLIISGLLFILVWSGISGNSCHKSQPAILADQFSPVTVNQGGTDRILSTK